MKQAGIDHADVRLHATPAWGFPLWCVTPTLAHYSGIGSASALFLKMLLEPVPKVIHTT
ncbi:MAG TPA: hypothetical protein VF534_29800 [Paraburkholderia sp.]